MVPLLMEGAAESDMPLAVREHLAASVIPTRKAATVSYWNQGPWEVGTRHPLDDCKFMVIVLPDLLSLQLAAFSTA